MTVDADRLLALQALKAVLRRYRSGERPALQIRTGSGEAISLATARATYTLLAWGTLWGALDDMFHVVAVEDIPFGEDDKPFAFSHLPKERPIITRH